MATNSKAMEDWFLRGGERPQENGMQQAPVVTCQNCGDDDDGYDACEECEDRSMCAKCHHVRGEPDDGEKAEYTVAVKYWRKVRYEAFVDVEADNPADAIAQAREMYEDMDLDPEEIDSEDFGEPEFEVDP